MRLSVFFAFLFFFYFLPVSSQQPIVGAERTWEYIPKLRSKTVGLVVNQTSVIGNTHLVDSLKKLNIKIKTIFAPEHGFRGTADAGAHISNGIDPKSKIQIVSLYGTKHAPSDSDLIQIQAIVFDIQDVGCRFYTFISTLHYVMEACAKNNVELYVLDRPNPNGMYIEGPVLKKEFQSFVGVDPIPILYGMTIGEYALMVKGEKWIENADSLRLSVIKCGFYNHTSQYKLPIKPSPNLPNSHAIALYPSLCLFEGTNVSVGRGTTTPFEVIGSPYFDSVRATYRFIPKPKPGAVSPFMLNKKCYGFNLKRDKPKGFTLSYLFSMYSGFKNKSLFFLENQFIDKLAGTDQIRLQLQKGKTMEEIQNGWKDELEKFKVIRKKYLLYD